MGMFVGEIPHETPRYVIDRDERGVIRGVRVENRPPPTLWRCSCEGCGAPLQRSDIQCSYCLRGTGRAVEQNAVYTQQQNVNCWPGPR